MNAIGPINRRIVAAAISTMFIAAGCVAGSPLSTLLGSPSSTLVTFAPSDGPSLSPTVIPSEREVQTPAPSRDNAPEGSVVGQVTAGPTCPVETIPPNPSCAPKPVAGAKIIATDSAGQEVGRAISKSDGTFALELVPGTYELAPQPTAGGSLRTPAVKSVTVQADSAPVVVDFSYDTGIR
jgi:hypothetical protein